MASYLGHLLQRRPRYGFLPCHPPANNKNILIDGPEREDRVVSGDEEWWDTFEYTGQSQKEAPLRHQKWEPR